MKTIQIPGTGIKPPDVSVAYLCRVKLQFIESGYFWRSEDGDDFSPSMFQGQAKAGDEYVSICPDYHVIVNWQFIPADGKTSKGSISVDQDGTCTDTQAIDG